ncbi:MAG TPA: non-ribosomal peptide synthase/polyketide synthase [Thermoanaerobaculia bacterium]|nr:non-ribosomal peptide synthase/polyketide synthase [Thermoanaerobaculia bacterium]
MTFLAAWKALLFRTTAQEDLVVGTPVAGRSPEETEGLIGLFVNTLALRTRVDGRLGFRALLGRVQETALAAFAHQDLPFEEIVEELAPERSLSHAPLVQVIFGLQDAATHPPELPGLAVRHFPAGHGTAKFDLALSLAEAGGGREARLDARADVYDEADLERLLAAFETLLAAALAEPDRALEELPLLSAAERRQVLVEWNDTAVVLPAEPTIPALFARQARERADAVALVWDGGSLSYGELEARSNRLARRLARLGVSAESLVGVALERSAELIVALLAIVKTGGAYLPLDPEYPRDRLAWMLEDARRGQGGLVVVTRGELAAGLPELPSRCRVVDLDREDLEKESAAPLAVPSSGDHLAYVLYTSGSTGRPKGVAVPHRAVARLVRGADYAELGPEEVFLQLAPVPFDASTLEIWGPLLNGGRLALLAPGRASLEELGGAIARHGVTTLWLTAGLFHQMVEAQLGALLGVRQLLAGGDVLAPAQVARVLAAREAAGGGGVVINGYGPTENTTFTCCHRMAAAAEVPASVPIGRPIANTRVYLLDGGLQPVPVGVAGELYAAGEGLARGYLHRPELTAERFVPDPFGDGGRLYRTGDLARWRPDGVVEFLGRLDGQVKLRGFRVEIGEVEAVLAAHPAVGQAAVALRGGATDGAEDKRLVAYVVPTEGEVGGPELVAALRSHLAQQLPDYMVPSAWVTLERLPLNANGKVDRGALPEPGPALGAETADAAPRTPLEELLVQVWEGLLAVRGVARSDSFFDLGGHSLLATRVVSRLRELLGVEVPLRALFEEPTLAGLAGRVETLLAAGESPSAPPLAPRPHGGRPLASFAQERIWFLDQMGGAEAWARAAYNVPLALDVDGPLDRPALAAALAVVVARHEVLRTSFDLAEGRLAQVVAPRLEPPLPLVDLSGLAAAAGGRADSEARRLAGEEARRHFDLARGPLLRCALLRRGPAASADRHRLLLTLHHVVADGWSLGVLLAELAELYAAALDRRPAALPPLRIQYADYAAWQRDRLAGPQLAAQLGHWLERLDGLPDGLELPADRPRPAAPDYRGARLRRHLPAGLLADLGALGRRQGTTLFMTLMAGFQALLARWSGSEDLAVGSPVAGRDRAELEGLIGLFVNTLVLRGDLSGDPRGTDLLARVREAALAAWAHQDLPFEKLVEELAPRRHLGRAPLFQVFMVLQNAPLSPPRLPGLAVRPVPPAEAEETAVKFDLALAFAASEDGLTLEAEYSRDIFEGASVARLVKHLETLLAGLAAAPELRVSELPLLSAAETRQLLVEWNDTGSALALSAAPALLHRLCAEQADRTPDAPAVLYAPAGGEAVELTYRALQRRARRLARHLRALGVGPEVRVGVALERTPELPVALLAVLEAGGAYVPLDPAYPAARLAAMVEDARAGQQGFVLLTQERLVPRIEAALGALDAPPVHLLCLDAEVDAGLAEAAEGEELLPAAVDPDNLAYLIYTSGSTGRPKGVAITHRSAAALLAWARTLFPPEDLAGVFASTSINFDLSVFELFVPLAGGGTVVLGEDALALAGSPLAARVTLVNTVPSAMAELVRLGAVPPTVRTVNLAGEPLRGALARRLYELPHVARVLNLYGPSEDTTYSTVALAPRHGEPTIGVPVTGTRAYVVDRWGRPAPAGVPGELLLGGEGLARGYLHRPDLTAERWVPDPFSGAAGARLYRTGDLARWLSEGELEFLGRIDHQVKVRGFRIEMGELEAALAAHPAVREAVVLARETPHAAGALSGEKRLVAYVVPAEGEVAGPELAAALRSHLAQQLPDYMVPSAWVTLERLPLNANGKVDRAALPEPGPAVGAATADAAPRTPLEELLAQVWEELLAVRGVSRSDSFFDLGGHSLLATRVVSRLRELLGVEVPLRALFEEPTVAGLAARVEALRAAALGTAVPPLGRRRRDGRAPASFAQERFWFLEQMEGQGAVYNVPAALAMDGPLEVPALAAALAALVARHEALRTSFAEEGGRVVQIVAPELPIALPLVDLSALGAQAAGEARRLSAAAAARPFDLARGPVLRALLLRLPADGSSAAGAAPARHLLHLCLHHVACDGWSMGVLFGELAELYGAAAGSRPAALAPLPIQYADFAAWQREWLEGPALEAQLGFWRATLAELPPFLELPTDRPRPAVRGFRGGRRTALLPPALAAGAAALGRRHGTTLFMTLLAAYQTLLSRSTGSERLAVGSPVAGRTQAATEGLIGCFVNTLAHAGDLRGDPTVATLLARTREATLDALAHQELPFEGLVEALQPPRDLVHPPLFQVMLVVQNTPAPAPPPRWPGLEVAQAPAGNASAKFDLTLAFAADGSGGLWAEVEYDRDLFDPATAERLERRLALLLGGMVEQPEARLSELPFLAPAELAQVLVEWNDTAAPVPGGTAVSAFEAWARRRPAATAVESAEGALTYGALAAWADRLAADLRGLGVGRGARVAVVMEHSAARVAAVLAVHKAGGAYVSLDPADPPERLGFLLADCGAAAALSAAPIAGGRRCFLVGREGLEPAGGATPPQNARPMAAAADPEDLAYVIYTSGSTGVPKGVEVPHRGLASLVAWHLAAYGLGPGDRTTQLAGVGFDASVWELWPALASGATLVVAPAELRADPPRLVPWLAAQEISVCFLPTPVAELALAEAWPPEVRLRVLLTGGDRLRRAPDPGLPFRLVNHYGPTEYSVVATCGEVVTGSAGAPTIGGPIANTRAYVLDGAGRPVPAGIAGELHLGGNGLARGYLARPDLTAERFLPDPFGGVPGGRLYRTGDLARWRPDGTIEFLGRLDGQVKLRGFRIETGEVEAVLAAHPAVAQAAVLLRTAAGGETGSAEDKRLVAYVVPGAEWSAGPELTEALRAHLAHRLPDYMVPSAWVALAELPLTPNGKLDRTALPEPDLAAAGDAYAPPRAGMEELLAGFWTELLGAPRVGAGDDFFALGGHSLLAARLVSRLREALGVELPLRRVFERPVLADLARELEAVHGLAAAAAGAAAPPLLPRRDAADGTAPLSWAQERLWFLDQFEPGTAAYNVPAVLRLTGSLRPDALAAAFAEVERRHEVLRTTFRLAADGDRPVQAIAPPGPARSLPLVDLSGLAPAAVEAEAARLAAAEALRPFDLAAGPLTSRRLLRLGGDRHLLLLNQHHIVTDGWSLGVLIRELSALYPALLEGRPAPLPLLPVQYADYAAWQREWLAGEVMASQVAHWCERLAGAPPLLELPTDRARPPVQSFRGDWHSLVLPAELTGALAALSRRSGASLFMTLLAGFKLQLARLAGREDVSVGSPIAGRGRGETEGLIGFFLNSLVLRTDLSGALAGELSFRDLLGRVRETALQAYAHQDVPFERLLEELQPARSLSYTPLFQVFLNMLNLPRWDRWLGPELALEVAGAPTVQSKFDLTLYVVQGPAEGDGLRIDWVYNADLFDRARVVEMGRQLEALLRQAVAAPEAPVAGFSLSSEAARAVLPDPAAPLDAAWRGSVPERFAEMARRFPQRPAVADGRRAWSYRELDEAASRLANLLRAEGVERGDFVVLWSHRSAPLVLALLGTLRAGAAFVSLDPDYPAPRLLQMLALARPKAFVALAAAGPVPAEVEEWLAASGCRCRLTLPEAPQGGASDPLLALLAAASPEDPRVALGPDDPAYAAFTSGSTGVPKGILGRHGSLTHFLPWQRREFGFDESDRFSMLSGLAHDPLHRDVFTPLQLGAAIAVPDPREIGTPGYLAAWMRRERVTVTHLTPAMGQLLAGVEGTEDVPAAGVPSLRWAFLVGDVLSRRDVLRLEALAPAATCVNYYGSTETQRAVGYHVAARGAGAGGTGGMEVLPLGRGIEDAQLLVLTPGGRLAGVGELGELAMRSPHIALGYIDEPELTARRFPANPLSGDAEDRIYRTGDLGRYLPNGEAVFAGRADLQVKVRGFRVEPGEIEAVLGRHPAVREAAVVARQDGGQDAERRLVAYVVLAEPAGDGEDAPEALRLDAETTAALAGHLRARLPDYMLPAAWVRLAALPLTPNRKVDRRALPAPVAASGPAAAPPRTPLERLVVAAWEEVLERRGIGRGDHFFELGGHSLLAARVAARLSHALGTPIPVRAFFEHPTPEALARRLEELGAGAAAAGEPAADGAEPEASTAPLSFAQARLWFLEQLAPGLTAYNLPLAIGLAGPLGGRERAALAAALSAVVRRHGALRTVFDVAGGEPVQRVLPPAPLPLPLGDLAGLPPERRGAEAGRLRATEAATAFDLARGPLFRVRLLRLAAAEHQLLLTAHHIVSDAWSSSILVRELVAGYRAALAGAPPDPRAVPPLLVQYTDHARRQRAWLQGAVLEEQVAYWRQALAGAPELLELPIDRPRPALQSFRGAKLRFTVPAALVGALRVLSLRRGASLFMTLLAGLQTLLGRYSGCADVPVGTAVAGRGRVETENLIGFFVNTLVLRGDLDGDPAFAELVARTREACLEAFAHQEVPFEKLVEELQPRRNLAHSPLFQVMLTLQNVPRQAPALPGLALSPLASDVGAAKFDLTFLLFESGDDLQGQVEYNRDLFHATTIDRLVAHFGNLLAAAAADAARRLSELPLIGRHERQQLLAEWNDSAAPYPQHLCLHQLFEARAAQAPQAVAVVEAGGKWISYGELNRRANRLAHHLRALGVAPGSLVGVHLERSLAMVTAVLAVQKAGGAYVPLEVSWPAQRVHGILERHRLGHLLTESGRQAAFAELPALPALRHVVCLDAWEDGAPGGLPVGDPAPAAGPDDLAYVIFTSGSTGTPKGVVVRHRPAVNLVHWVNQTFGVGPADRLLFITALSFDLSVYDIFGVLAAGASIRLATSEEVRDAEGLVRILRREPITFWDSAPAALQQCTTYFQEPASRFDRSIDSDTPHLASPRFTGGGSPLSGGTPVPFAGLGPPALRLVFLSGDWIPVSLPDRVRAAFPRAWVIGLGGATEATVWSNVYPIGEVDPAWKSVPYGRPIENARYHVLDRRLEPCPIGVAGDLYIGGDCLSDGYADEPELTARKYLPDPFSGMPGARLYQTGDRARAFADGNLEFLGRSDTQVKVRGYRIELGEVEAALAAHPAVREAVVLTREDAVDPARVESVRDQRLVAYLIPRDGVEADAAELRRHLRARLPEYMVPAAFVWRQSWPLSATGKLDRKALPPPERPAGTGSRQDARAAVGARNGREDLEETIAAVWREVIGTEAVGRNDNFFDLGGHSLLMARVQARLGERLERSLPLVELFQHPTVAALAEHLLPDAGLVPAAAPAARERRGSAIAVIGMAGRFPGAPDLETFWDNLRAGVESIRFFGDEELLATGLDPATLADPRVVKARGAIEDPDLFDAAFFDVPPREAQLLDPQQRFFLETCWQALEDAGYSAAAHRGRVGVWAGVSESTYLHELLRDPELVATVGALQLLIANGHDYVPTRVSYKLDLRGPSVNVQTACSTSLVAVHTARLALLHGECDLALAGGASVQAREVRPYRYQEGGTYSPDGHIRAFDAAAGGMITGSGVGVVVLKRLEDALADGDRVRAVILGSASNNDGAAKVGFTAPSVEGQATAIREAQAAAGVHPDTIRYVEAHGTGTPVGDPIEIAGLTRAFRAATGRRGFCAVGTVKPNIGHLDTAAGVAGLIKTVLALEHREIPPSINFREPNPEIDFAASPFYVAARLESWSSDGAPRRAGVSSFGIGGTNAHLVLEEGPAPEPSGPARPAQLLLLSAKTPTALAAAAARLADHLEARPEWGAADLADAAFTLRLGRAELRHRRAVVCRGRAEAAAVLRGEDPVRSFTRAAAAGPTSTLFLFPGQGAQHVGMATELYAEEPVFRAALDECAEGLVPDLGYDLRGLLYPPAGADLAEAAGRLRRTEAAQPALFAVEYALARLWRAWGIEPRGMLGHSIGELVAACLAGVFPLPEALRLVALRGRLMGELPAGVMLAVPLPEAEVGALLAEHGDLALAAVNAPASCVVSGREEGIARLERELAAVETRRLHTSHAFHSAMMDPVLEPFAAAVRAARPRPPEVPFISNLTGAWITAEEATDPAYWARQMRHTVRFADGLATLLATPGRALLEVGPGRTLVTLAHQHPDKEAAEVIAGSLGRARDAGSDLESALSALGRLWAAGVPVDHAAFFAHERRRRVPLPTYPFERKRYWIDVQPAGSATRARAEDAAEPPLGAVEDAGEAAAPAGHVAPRNELEAEIAAAFRAQLGVERLSVNDDFFEIGGSSLMAVQLGARLRDRLGVELSSNLLLEASTVAGLAERIARERGAEGEVRPAAPPSCLVPLQTGGGRRSLFLVHQVGGNVFTFRALARELGRDQPVYGLRSLGLEAAERPLATIPEMAEHYLELVRGVQPRGPYLLGGASMGGMVAFDMAQRLVAAGEEVSLLTLMDTPRMDQVPNRPPTYAEFLGATVQGKVPLTREDLVGLEPEEQLALVVGRMNEPDPELAARILRVRIANTIALFDYTPQPYPGALLFFRAAERRPVDDPHPELHWPPLAGDGVEVLFVPGTHESMHEPPNVRAIAQRLRRRLREAAR